MDRKWRSIGFGASLGIMFGIPFHNYALGLAAGLAFGVLLAYVRAKEGR